MSLAEIEEEITHLAVDERQKLAAFLAALRMKDSGEWQAVLQERGADVRDGWVSLEEARKRLLEPR